MKKILLATILSFLAFASSVAQLQIVEYGEASTMREYEKEACSIYWIEDGYYFVAWDYECASYNLQGNQYCVLIFLGITKEDVKQSRVILEDWYKTASNESYIYVTNPNGQRVCIYKYNSNLYCSYGTELDCKQTQTKYSSSIASMLTAGFFTVLTGIDYSSSVANSYEIGRKELLANVAFGEHILTSGVSFKKDLIRSFDNFQIEEDNRVRFQTDTYTQKIIHKVSKVRELYQRHKLLESIAFTTFYNICNPYMSSQNYQDWLRMERLAEVMLHMMIKEPCVKREVLEHELLNVFSEEEKIEVFERYYKLILSHK